MSTSAGESIHENLVIIPSLMHKYSFSAPLAWLFGRDKGKVQGIYSAFLDKQHVREYDSFIVELNWFIELYEFGLIVRFIKRHNKNAKILFGGLYSQIAHERIFAEHPVDYFIKGDAEEPIRQYLNGAAQKTIPNPPESRLYTEFVFPYWTDWNFYTDPKKALSKSRQWYMVTGQTKLYPPPRRFMTHLIRPMVINTIRALQKARLVDIQRFLR